MSKYSLLFEADTYHEIGPFRFPVYHDFTPGETKGFERLAKQHANSTYKSMQLAAKIAKEKNIKASEALKILSGITNDANQDYLFEYSDEVRELSDSVLSEQEQTAQFVTLFMQMRGEVKLPESDHWTRTEDWTSEDTDTVPGALIKQINEFIDWERNGWPEPGKDGKPALSAREQRILKASSTSS